MKQRIIPILQAILAAALFGASVPLSKVLLGQIDPFPLSSLQNLGCGLGLFLLGLLSRKNRHQLEARLVRAEWPWLAGGILVGGVAAPIVLMFSLRQTPAATASLLLNFEAAATALVAVLIFREAVGRRVWLALVLVTGGSVLLSLDFTTAWGFSLGALGVVAACACWGLDNNFTRNISAKDPRQIVMIRGLVAGSVSCLITLTAEQGFPSFGIALEALVMGFVCYGLGMVFFILALRQLGATRTVALLATAPFVGTVLSFIIFHEPLNLLFLAALPLMIGGALLLAREEHEHLHHHLALQHEHRHRHDDGHHQHNHPAEEFSPSVWHSHLHEHPELEHAHPHTPDLHHRHRHGS
jgi:drug/metabolite transporter (DMT)-like permease